MSIPALQQTIDYQQPAFETFNQLDEILDGKLSHSLGDLSPVQKANGESSEKCPIHGRKLVLNVKIMTAIATEHQQLNAELHKAKVDEEAVFKIAQKLVQVAKGSQLGFRCPECASNCCVIL